MDPVPALVVVDIQVGLLTGPDAVPGAAALTGRVAELLRRARAAGALTVQLRNAGPAGTPDAPGTPGWALRLAPAGDVVLDKATDDGFAGTGLAELLGSRGVRRFALCGVLSEMCVSATARAALARGLAVVLPHDGHGTYDLGDIPAATVARVAEHALGDEPELVPRTADVPFTRAAPDRLPG